jgi:hypothetical protein
VTNDLGVPAEIELADRRSMMNRVAGDVLTQDIDTRAQRLDGSAADALTPTVEQPPYSDLAPLFDAYRIVVSLISLRLGRDRN